MSQGRANSTALRRRLFGLVLCYALALQAILAAYGIARAGSPANETFAGFAVCHNAGDDAPTKPDSQSPVSLPCALCAMAAQTIALLPATLSAVVAPSASSGRVPPADITVLASLRSARAGLARAPPRFA